MFARASGEPAYRPGPDTDGSALVERMGLPEEEFATRFSGSLVERAKRRAKRIIGIDLGGMI